MTTPNPAAPAPASALGAALQSALAQQTAPKPAAPVTPTANATTAAPVNRPAAPTMHAAPQPVTGLNITEAQRAQIVDEAVSAALAEANARAGVRAAAAEVPAAGLPAQLTGFLAEAPEALHTFDAAPAAGSFLAEDAGPEAGNFAEDDGAELNVTLPPILIDPTQDPEGLGRWTLEVANKYCFNCQGINPYGEHTVPRMKCRPEKNASCPAQFIIVRVIGKSHRYIGRMSEAAQQGNIEELLNQMAALNAEGDKQLRTTVLNSLPIDALTRGLLERQT